MSHVQEIGATSLPLSEAQAIDEACDRFESAWQAGEQPRIEEFLVDSPQRLRPSLFRELLALELAYRCENGDPPLLNEYRARFPDHAQLIDAICGRMSRSQHSTTEHARGDHQTTSANIVTAAALPPDYEIQCPLGKGGMGLVYKARQMSANRTVALKLIRPDRLAELAAEQRREWLARFRTEAQAAARLEDDHIVTVYEVGESQGQPYYSMRYVEGCSLAEILRAGPLPSRRAAALLEPIARAAHHAHEQGILHRDLKPRNILVDAADRPYVTDFGLAKWLGDVSGVTHTGDFLGTPAYMAPEQVRDAAHVSAAADLYGLGATLYECLTGGPPFRAAASAEIVHQLIHNEPVAPRQLNPGIDRDLETICLKCLRKEPGNRYATAGALADDLRRYLDGRPIMARPIRGLERIWRWCLRKPAGAGLIGAATLLVLGVFAVSLWYARTSAESAVRREYGHQEFDLACNEAQQIRDDLQGRLRDPNETSWLLNRPAEWQARVDTARAALRRAETAEKGARLNLAPADRQRVERLRELLDADDTDRQFAVRLDTLRLEAFIPLGGKWDQQATAPKFHAAFRDGGWDVNAEPPVTLGTRIRESALRWPLVAALDHWATLTPDWDLNERLLRIAREADPDTWRDRFRDVDTWHSRAAMTRLAADPAVARQTPAVLFALALRLKGIDGDAVGLLRASVLRQPNDFWLNFQLGHATTDVREKIGCYRATLAIRPDNSAAYNQLGLALRDARDTAGAIAAFRKAVELEPNFVFALTNLGNALREAGDVRESIVALRRATELDPELIPAWHGLGNSLLEARDYHGAVVAYRQLAERDPKNAEVYFALGRALRHTGDRAEAIAIYRNGLELAPTNAKAHNSLGLVYHDLKKLPEAIDCYRKATELDPKLVEAHSNLGNALKDAGDIPGSLAAHQKAVETAPTFAKAHLNMGQALLAKGDTPGAIASYRRAAELDPKLEEAHYNLAGVLKRAGDLPGAIAAYQRAIEAAPMSASAHYNLGNVLKQKGDWNEAIDCFRRAIEINPKHAMALNNLGNTLLLIGDRPAAITAYRQSIEADPRLPQPHANLGDVLREAAELDEAIAEYRKAITLRPGLPEPHCNLGHALRERGKFTEALESLQRGHEIGSKLKTWRYPSSRWIEDCKRLIAVDTKLPGLLRGEAKPADAAETLDAAEACYYKRLFGHSAQFYQAAFAAQPQFTSFDQFLAAKAAALAGCGQGNDNSALDEQARTSWRRQAIVWLGDELNRVTKNMRDDKSLAVCLDRWLRDPAFAGMRGDAITKLPADEQAAWTKLWADVDSLRAKVGLNATPKSRSR